MVHLLEEPMILMAKGFVFATHSFKLMIYHTQLFLRLSPCRDRSLETFDVVGCCANQPVRDTINPIAIPLDSISHLLDLLP